MIPPETEEVNPMSDWPKQEPLPEGLPSVESFSYELLPEKLRPWIQDITERMQCPPDFPAIGAIISLSAVVGRQIGIRPKRHDDWLVVPNLWGGVIGRPGIMKSPALDQSKLPLKRLSAEMIKKYNEEAREQKTQETVIKAKREVLESSLKKAIKAGSDTSGIEAGLTALSDDSSYSVCQRYFVNDSTVEKLGEILQENPNGVMVFRDELTGWLRSLDREGHENDRAFYLEAWNGTGDYTYDRIGRGTVRIPSVCLSILGGIQPGPLAQYVMDASRNGSGADGLLQRFQLLVWPDDPKDWSNVDRWPNTVAKNRAFEVFDRLSALEFSPTGDSDEIPFLHFTDEAQDAFDKWREILETEKLRSGESDMIESALSKYRSLIPSLALLFHLVDVGTGPVELLSLIRAVDWGDYLESHMRRIYSAMNNPSLTAAHRLLQKIHEGKVTEWMTLREVYFKGWSGLTRETLPEA